MGAKNNEGGSGAMYLSLKAKTSDTDGTPYFGKNEKINGEWTITERYNSVDGYLKNISHSTYEYQGETKHKCKMEFQDKDGSKTFVKSNFNNLLYGILNSFAGTQNFGLIDINVWLGKPREGQEKGFPSSKVTNDGEKTDWGYDFKLLPKPEKVQFKGKTVTDDEQVVKFWTKAINEINEKIQASAPKQPEMTREEAIAAYRPKNNETTAPVTAPPVDDGLDLPF